MLKMLTMFPPLEIASETIPPAGFGFETQRLQQAPRFFYLFFLIAVRPLCCLAVIFTDYGLLLPRSRRTSRRAEEDGGEPAFHFS